MGMYPDAEEITDIDFVSGRAPVMDEYPAGGGAQLIDDYAYVPLEIQRHSVVPISQGVAAFQKGDNGKLRNRHTVKSEDYDSRIAALTVVHNGPEYYGIVQHTTPDTAQFAVQDSQTKPLMVDESHYQMYVSPDEAFLNGE